MASVKGTRGGVSVPSAITFSVLPGRVAVHGVVVGSVTDAQYPWGGDMLIEVESSIVTSDDHAVMQFGRRIASEWGRYGNPEGSNAAILFDRDGLAQGCIYPLWVADGVDLSEDPSVYRDALRNMCRAQLSIPAGIFSTLVQEGDTAEHAAATVTNAPSIGLLYAFAALDQDGAPTLYPLNAEELEALEHYISAVASSWPRRSISIIDRVRERLPMLAASSEDGYDDDLSDPADLELVGGLDDLLRNIGLLDADLDDLLRNMGLLDADFPSEDSLFDE